MSSGRDVRNRICVIRHFYYPADPRVRKEVEALEEAGYEVDVICLRKPGEKTRETVAGATAYRLPVQHLRAGPLRYAYEYGSFLLLAAITAGILHLRRRYSVVQVNNMPDFLVFAAAIPKLMGAKIIFDSHDLMPELYASKRGCSQNSLVPRLFRIVEKWSCGFADHVISVTEVWKDRLSGRSVSRDKCTIVMNVADSRIFSAGLRDNGRGLGDTFTLLYHGALIHRYGVDLAIRAMKIVKQENPRCRLEVIGEGEQLPELKKLVAELGLEKEVNLWGKAVPAEQVAKAIAASDAGIVPHRGDPFTNEILPNKLLEYVAMGVPVIASRTSGVQSYFDDSMLLFFEPDNEYQLAERILQIVADPQLASTLVSNTNRFNALHNWDSMKQTYRKLIDTHARGTSGPKQQVIKPLTEPLSPRRNSS